VRLADIALRGEMGIPGALTAPQWGFYDVLFSKTNKDQAIKPEEKRQFSFQRGYGSYVMENILFKIRFPAEFHAQTACEAAVLLYPEVKDRLDDIEKIVVTTHESAIRIISKEGPLANPADRDHCLQYMIAVPLIMGDLSADHYEDSFHASNPMIDTLRNKMEIVESADYTLDYLDPEKRSIANAIQVFFSDGTKTDVAEVEYPIGHRRRREEGMPVLEKKLHQNLLTCFPPAKAERILGACNNPQSLASMPVHEFMNTLTL
jgi:2-methylcitrate dehydratase